MKRKQTEQEKQEKQELYRYLLNKRLENDAAHEKESALFRELRDLLDSEFDKLTGEKHLLPSNRAKSGAKRILKLLKKHGVTIQE